MADSDRAGCLLDVLLGKKGDDQDDDYEDDHDDDHEDASPSA
jgi:hypothetical protein